MKQLISYSLLNSSDVTGRRYIHVGTTRQLICGFEHATRPINQQNIRHCIDSYSQTGAEILREQKISQKSWGKKQLLKIQ